MKPHVTWYALIDGARARVLKREDDGRWETLSELESADARRKSSELGHSGPGTSHESATSARHSIQPRADYHDTAKHDFVATVASQLNEAFRRREFDSLVLAAPPRLLPDLRAALDAGLHQRVREVPKDLTKAPVAELDAHLLENRSATA